ncbi:MAG TPA: hypothetical protein VNX68_11300 [Nitrosopumilaceae archaeon]|jgi:hypothetical protein|nr:hypothetical protein [Nitrosopumilaceae archaeon]
MGAILSSTTVYANAYLTELGRTYIFDSPDTPRYITLDNGQTIDRLQIQRFSLGDTDVNYRIAELLTSGEVPDESGDSASAIKGAKGRTLDHLISPGDTILPSDTIDTLVYTTTYPNVTWDLGASTASLPSVVTQQLMTYIDGLLVSDGAYVVTPKNYGKIKAVNDELIITILNPTTLAAGYRLRVFFPKTGTNYNKMTFQFEKSDPIKSVIIQSTNTQTITDASAVTVNPANLTTS